MKNLLLALLLVSLTFSAYAAEIAGVQLPPESINVSDENLKLNGIGIRKKFIVKVYASGLYLKDKETSDEAILNADQPMIIRMIMLYEGGVSPPEKLRKTWVDGFEANSDDTASLKERIETLTSWFTEETREGDTYELFYMPGKGTRLSINDSVKGVIEGLDFKKHFSPSGWGGKNLPTKTSNNSC